MWSAVRYKSLKGLQTVPLGWQGRHGNSCWLISSPRRVSIFFFFFGVKYIFLVQPNGWAHVLSNFDLFLKQNFASRNFSILQHSITNLIKNFSRVARNFVTSKWGHRLKKVGTNWFDFEFCYCTECVLYWDVSSRQGISLHADCTQRPGEACNLFTRLSQL